MPMTLDWGMRRELMSQIYTTRLDEALTSAHYIGTLLRI
ncbi:MULTISPECIES: DUF4113 domain-containing protein [Pseudomonas syringae group]|nr:DUF4113 domain-containing protein [Pseudomonas syringae]